MVLEEIIRLAKERDRRSQAALFAHFKVKWFMIALRYASNRDDASDILQDALTNIFQKLDQFKSEKGSFESWSSKIVVNQSLMFLRKYKSTFNHLEIKEELLLRDENETPLEALSTEELTKLIQSLPMGYRTVFNLYAIEGYNHQEISEILDISTGTSKSQLSKARKLLQQKLEVIL